MQNSKWHFEGQQLQINLQSFYPINTGCKYSLDNDDLKFYVSFNTVFVCVQVLWPSQPNRVMLSAVILPNHTFIGQA